MDSPDAWLTTEQAAVRAGLSSQHIRNLAQQARIPADIHTHFGRRFYRFPADQFERWLADRPQRRTPSRPDARLAQLEETLLTARLELERERAGRQLAEQEIYRLQRELDKRIRAIAVLAADAPDPGELLAARDEGERR